MNEIEFIKQLSETVKSGREEVTLIVKGKFSNRGYKKLYGVKGEQVVEGDNGVMCVFPAKELLQAVINTLPKVIIREGNHDPELLEGEEP